jgi:hypothetical protein
VITLDNDARKLLADGDFKGVVARAIREQRMIQLQEAALLKVREGTTSLEEVQRIFAPKQAVAAKAGTSSSASPPAPTSTPQNS